MGPLRCLATTRIRECSAWGISPSSGLLLNNIPS